MAENDAGTTEKQAVLYRMVMPKHVCPFGLKALDLLRRKGFTVDDRHLTTREQADAFKEDYGVKTTPQIFIDDNRIGGLDDLRRFFGQSVNDPKAPSYEPVAAVFAMSALMAFATSYAAYGTFGSPRMLPLFIAFSMAVLAIMKLQNLETFSSMFLGYDLLAKRWVPYSYAYPFLEGLAALLMIAGALTWVAAPISIAIGGIGAVSVIKAVYIDRRSLKCACVGGGTNVPLGFLSLTENVMMAGMGVWMIRQMFIG